MSEKIIPHFASPKVHQLRKIEEIRSISYEERIKRLLVLIEVSFKIQKASKRK